MLQALLAVVVLGGGGEEGVVAAFEGRLDGVLHHADDEACMATSLPMPKKEQAIGMSSNEPPATSV